MGFLITETAKRVNDGSEVPIAFVVGAYATYLPASQIYGHIGHRAQESSMPVDPMADDAVFVHGAGGSDPTSLEEALQFIGDYLRTQGLECTAIGDAEMKLAELSESLPESELSDAFDMVLMSIADDSSLESAVVLAERLVEAIAGYVDMCDLMN